MAVVSREVASPLTCIPGGHLPQVIFALFLFCLGSSYSPEVWILANKLCWVHLEKGTYSLLDLFSGSFRQKDNLQGLQTHIFQHRSLFSHPEQSDGTRVALCPKVLSYRDAKLKHNVLFLHWVKMLTFTSHTNLTSHCKTFLPGFLLQLKPDTKGIFVSLNCF